MSETESESGPPPGRRGRPPRYTRHEVVAAAIELADAEGLPAVTMRAVASRLDTSVMSLYSYVTCKQVLVYEMLEQVGERSRLPEPSGDWREDLHALAHSQRRVALQHPWVLDAVSPSQPPGPALLAYLEFGLAALEPLGLDPGRKLETVALLTGSVINLVRAELAERETGPSFERQTSRAAETHRLLATGDYPRLAAAFTAGTPPRPLTDPIAEFDRLVDRFLDGLAAPP